MKKLGKALGVTVLTLGITTQSVQAADDNNEQKEPELKEDVITYGGDLNQQQKDEVKEKLGAKDSYKSIDVSLSDVSKFTGVKYYHIYSSSVI